MALSAFCIAVAGTASAQDARLCGSGQIRGERLAAINAEARGCGLSSPVAVHEVQGVRLNPPATLSCAAAKALRRWVRKSAKPRFSGVGGGLAELRVFDSYNCRPRNNVRGARVSVHGSGLAIDIGAFRMKDGRTVSVLSDWNDRQFGKLLRKVHRDACGTFSTVLGPDHNRAHRNHFHFDRERHHGGGAYCQ